MTDYYLRSSSAAERVRGNTYSLGDRVVIARADAQGSFATMRRFVYECTIAGTANGAGDPIYPTTAGGTVLDGGVLQWTCRECTSWANANKYADYLATRLVAGDRMLVSQAHSETSSVSVTSTFPGTPATPCYFLCVDDSSGALTTGATITTTGATTLTLTGAIIGYGISFSSSSGAAGTNFVINPTATVQRWLNCEFIHASTATAQMRINYSGGGWNAGIVFFEGCRLKLLSTGSRILLCGMVRMNGMSFSSGSSTPTSIFGLVPSAPFDLEVTNSDFSILGSGVNLVAGGAYLGLRAVLKNVKMPAGWSGQLVSSAISSIAMYVEAYNVDGGDTNYTAYTEDYAGSLRHDTAIYLSGTNGIKLNGTSISLSYKMTASANAKFSVPKYGLWRALVNETTTSQTATLEIIHNEAANLTDEEIWLELDYPETTDGSNFSKFARLTDFKTDLLATAVAQATSSAADWDDGLSERVGSSGYVAGALVKSSGSPGSAFICTTAGTSAASVPGGYTTAADGASITDGTAVFKAMRRQKLTISFTAAEQGIIRMRPVLALAGAVVWSAAKVSVA